MLGLCLKTQVSCLVCRGAECPCFSSRCRLCTTLIRVCAQHGQAATALAIYDWMRGKPDEGGAGLTATVYTYTAAMRAALTGNLMDRALQVRNSGACEEKYL